MNIFDVQQPFYVLLNAVSLTLVWLFANRTLKFASASYTVIMSSVTPIIVTLLALLFLHKDVERIQIVGMLLIISSSFVSEYLVLKKKQVTA